MTTDSDKLSAAKEALERARGETTEPLEVRGRAVRYLLEAKPDLTAPDALAAVQFGLAAAR